MAEYLKQDHPPENGPAEILVAATDLICHHADALLDLAEVLDLGGRIDSVAEAASTSLRLYKAKGNTVGAARAQALLRRRERSAHAVHVELRRGQVRLAGAAD